jgi:hypothetical protein
LVRVVLGEAAEPHPGPIQLALMGSGILVSGQASSLEELERVLEGIHPDAVVLGPHMGAMAVLTARDKAPGAAIVVVWPSGVSGAIADEQVAPTHIVQELGLAVRRAVARVPLHPAAAELAPVIDISALRAVGTEVPEPLVILSSASTTEPAEAEVVEIGEARSRRRALPALLAAAAFLLIVVVGVSLNKLPTRTGALPPPPTTSSPTPQSPGPTGSNSNSNSNTNQTQPSTNPPAPIQEAALVVSQTGTSATGVATGVGGQSQGAGGSGGGGVSGGGGGSGGGGTGGGSGPPATQGPPFGRASHGPPAVAGKSREHGFTGQHGKSGEQHGKSGEQHGKSGEQHGKSREQHGKSGEQHGKSGQQHGHSSR